jgi:undecaprenyl-diphosphatase
LLLRYLRRNSMYVFVWYRIALGVLLLALLGLGVLTPLG